MFVLHFSFRPTSLISMLFFKELLSQVRAISFAGKKTSSVARNNVLVGGLTKETALFCGRISFQAAKLNDLELIE